jgi:hypothetical protein
MVFKKKEYYEVIHISPFVPGLRSGGAITVLMNANAITLTRKKTLHIWPEMKNENSKIINQFSDVWMASPASLLDKIKIYLKGESFSSYSTSIINKLNKLNVKNSIVVIESTRLGSVAKYCKINGAKIVVNQHNFEPFYFIENWGLLSKIFKIKNVYLSEFHSFKNTHLFIYLSKIDLNRVIHNFRTTIDLVHKPKLEHGRVRYPFSLEINNLQYSTAGHLLITGSFAYSQNSMKIINFLSNYYGEREVVIAGSNLKAIASNMSLIKNCKLRIEDSPTDKEMQELFSTASCFINISTGKTGVKVKVAEAISYSLPVFSLQEGAIGYEDCPGLLTFESIEAMANAVARISNQDLLKMNYLQRNYYESIFSMNACQNFWKHIFSKVNDGELNG